MSYLERAITDGHAKLTGEGKQQKILYVAVNHTERYADPEEQVRAEFWAELI
jgi:type I restriction enzyme M protein